jgi:capsular exopolysaccharide synthesis family protein
LPLAAAIDSLQASMKVTRRGREADIIEVRVEGTDRYLVRDVPNVLLTNFISRRHHARRADTRSTAKFLRGQIERLGQQLQAAEDSLRAFRERTGVVSLAEQAGASVRRVAELQGERAHLDVERGALAKLLRATESSARENPDGAPAYRQLIAFPSLLRSQVAAGLLTSLTVADDRRAELLSRRRPDDPDVRALTSRITDIEGQLKTIATTYLAGLTSQVEALDQELRASAHQMARIPEAEVRSARLERQARMLDGIFTVLQSRLKEAELAEAVEDPSVRIVDVAGLPQLPVRPKPLLNLVLAVLAGLSIGIGTGLALEYADRSVHTRQELRAATGVPVMGFIPRANGSRRGAVNGRGSFRRLLPLTRAKASEAGNSLLLRPGSVHSAMAEAYRRLDTTLTFADPSASIRRLLVTSALPGEGKTTCAINLAVTLVRRGRRVLLIDGDLRRGRIATALGLKRTPGLAEVLLGSADATDAISSVRVDDGTLSVLTTGARGVETQRLLSSHRLGELFTRLAWAYDVVVIDSPPVNVVGDAALLATHTDAVILVARAGSTTGEALSFGMEQLRGVRAPVVGALLNDVDVARESRYDATYRYYQHPLYAQVS